MRLTGPFVRDAWSRRHRDELKTNDILEPIYDYVIVNDFLVIIYVMTALGFNIILWLSQVPTLVEYNW